jgi:hypothetical protein
VASVGPARGFPNTTHGGLRVVARANLLYCNSLVSARGRHFSPPSRPVWQPGPGHLHWLGTLSPRHVHTGRGGDSGSGGSSAGPGRRRPQQRDEAGQAECPAPRGASGAGARPVRSRSPGLRVRHTADTQGTHKEQSALRSRPILFSKSWGAVLSLPSDTHASIAYLAIRQ